MRHLFTSALLAASLIAGAATPVFAAAPCRDAHGKFVKCTPKAAPKTTAVAAKPVRCRDAHNKFAKCGTPGAKPAA